MSKARNLANLLSDGVISANELAEGAALPSQSGQSGKYLTTDGSDASWAVVQALPSQEGESGKYLTTNGTSPSWADILSGADVDGGFANSIFLISQSVDGGLASG